MGGGSSSGNKRIGSTLVYQSGDTALLPCDVSVPSDGADDGLVLIMWYREDVKSPIYSIDARAGKGKIGQI